MALRYRETTKPTVCPYCESDYDFRVPKRLDGRMSLAQYYRCRTKGYVYIHRIEGGVPDG